MIKSINKTHLVETGLHSNKGKGVTDCFCYIDCDIFWTWLTGGGMDEATVVIRTVLCFAMKNIFITTTTQFLYASVPF